MINKYEKLIRHKQKLNTTHLDAKSAFKYEMIFKTRTTQIWIFYETKLNATWFKWHSIKHETQFNSEEQLNTKYLKYETWHLSTFKHES